MALGYLCSRTDVLRALYFDTDRKVMVLGAPKDFLDWIGRVLPGGSRSADDIESNLKDLGDDSFRIALLWLEGRDDLEKVLASAVVALGPSTDLWAVIERDRTTANVLGHFCSDRGLTRRSRMELTARSDIVPIVMREREM